MPFYFSQYLFCLVMGMQFCFYSVDNILPVDKLIVSLYINNSRVGNIQFICA